ncbi:GNAT family N-acetyltransferase [Candidatus Dojkabacteria bacterium]|uniref:GNAT family N-acetyltransferase n=1 Tax=Candidatus Dojkabacteria bacterium TaxID=2099670 RepID=A0A955LBG5_9BACT|nr:GNAT family N-acetyltransferase [Candidatus Dojkabacteria bacterium]
MEIRKAVITDFENIKSMMLKALRSDPNAFSVNYEEYASCSNYWWQNYLSDYLAGLYSHMYFAQENEIIVGMAGLNFSRKIKQQHSVDFVWFFVDQEHRGKGIGRKILEHIHTVLKEREEIVKIALSVVSTQTKAIELYKKFGYSVSGNQRRHIKSGNDYLDLIIMEKHLRP